jgi:hypothetical protein
MPRSASTPSPLKASRVRGLDISRAKKRMLAKLQKYNAIDRALMKMGNSELMEKIQHLRLRPLVKAALADPVPLFRQSLVNEYKSLTRGNDLNGKMAGAKTSKRTKSKCTTFAMTSRPRIRTRRK